MNIVAYGDTEQWRPPAQRIHFCLINWSPRPRHTATGFCNTTAAQLRADLVWYVSLWLTSCIMRVTDLRSKIRGYEIHTRDKL